MEKIMFKKKKRERIPEGAFYSSCKEGILNAGKRFPLKPIPMDRYYYGDYIYTYYNGNKGWGVQINLDVTNKNRDEYGPILDKVGMVPVVSMSGTFEGCKELIKAPDIPQHITNMHGTFSGCEKLLTAPIIPDNVKDMDYCFYNCFSLRNPPVMPDGVANASYIFTNCKSLKYVFPSLKLSYSIFPDSSMKML